MQTRSGDFPQRVLLFQARPIFRVCGFAIPVLVRQHSSRRQARAFAKLSFRKAVSPLLKPKPAIDIGDPMSLKEQITEDMKAAMRAKDSARLGTIRLLTAAMKQKEVDERIELNDAQVLAIIEKMIKQRKDSITQFEAGGRQDLADNEKAELVVLSAYMPAALSDAEIQAEVQAALAATGAAGPQDMGKVMGVLKPKLAGRADMTAVSAMVKAALTKS
jgi:uncharacterized protein YqeY